MRFELFEPVSAGRADWLPSRLTGDFGSVMRHVPDGFPAYARILHPPRKTDGTDGDWGTVARLSGRVAHRVMQWEAIATPPSGLQLVAAPWRGGGAMPGSLSPDLLELLAVVLAGHTGDPGDCLCGYWDGRRSTPAATSKAAMLTLPGRRYSLRRCGLVGEAEAGGEEASGLSARAALDWQSPNLLWPSDKSWFVSTEVDFDSTLVGGSPELVADLLAEQGFEAWSMLATDSLADDSDTINSG
jgi:hypothetical protein